MIKSEDEITKMENDNLIQELEDTAWEALAAYYKLRDEDGYDITRDIKVTKQYVKYITHLIPEILRRIEENE